MKKFAGNPDVVFGDVNLSKNQVRIGSPGAGGWPTLRYFNKATGYEGEAYKQKTQDAMCTELGPGKPHLENAILELGGTSLCNIDTKAGCSEKETSFIAKWVAKAASTEELDKQITRLEKMSGSSMKADLATWLSQRLAIFKQLRKAADGGAKEL